MLPGQIYTVKKMNEIGQIEEIKKPTSVTVFGVLNIVFGGLFFICTPIAIFGYLVAAKKLEITYADKVSSIVSISVSSCLSTWQLILGIGLLKFKKWSRFGSIIYACCDIFWTISGFIASIVLSLLGLTNMMQSDYINQTIGIVVGLIYPALLLIFMKSQKVKNAFALIGG
jgi:hypothetical protein